MNKGEYPVAQLSDETLNKLQHIESELRKQTDEDIVLIAYKKEQEAH
ncbi:hypothetical protein HP456_15175 [Bacillus haikouensis]|jgi:hypothetical protein|nr:hypothetical protein [Bacillus haikouensis]NQD67256.1 hypothetical protein [Bacillus haikouensis]